jgi:hypothetical protein
MNIEIPPALTAHTGTIQEFLEGMVFKLAVNAFKDDTVAKDIPILIDRMLEELQELRNEITSEGIDPNALSETFDGANFFYLMYRFMRRSGVPDGKERFIKEFLRVDYIVGRVFAAKTRSGSRYREGEEILGTYRKGRCYIRIQDATTGQSVSIPRDHLVWWVATGCLPEHELRHKNDLPGDDSFDNLQETETRGNRQFPFVSQWKPRGKENHPCYGKWRYQRRFNFVLISCGYWDTEEEAAREGLAAWKKRTKELKNAG